MNHTISKIQFLSKKYILTKSVKFHPPHSACKLLKMSHLNFSIWHFPPIFFLIKVTCLVTLFDRSFRFSKSSPKCTIFGISNWLFSTQNINSARFARNVECDFLDYLIEFWNSVVMKMVNHVLNLPKPFFLSSWIVVDGLGPQTLLTTQNQLMIAAMKTWEAIAEFWPDLPRIMDLIPQRKWSRWYTTFLIFKRGHNSFFKNKNSTFSLNWKKFTRHFRKLACHTNWSKLKGSLTLISDK